MHILMYVNMSKYKCFPDISSVINIIRVKDGGYIFGPPRSANAVCAIILLDVQRNENRNCVALHSSPLCTVSIQK